MGAARAGGAIMRFLFDFISPYAYLAFTQLPRVEAAVGRTFALEPVLFAGLLSAHGNLGPAEILAKRQYIIRDLVRMSQELGVPLDVPPAHPFNPLVALRVSCAAQQGVQRRAVVKALFDAVWRQGRAIDTAAAVAAALEGVVEAPEALVQRAGEPEIKAALRAQTAQAAGEGVFGVPTAVVDGEYFWGAESLRHIERGWRPDEEARALLARWDGLEASATRPRK